MLSSYDLKRHSAFLSIQNTVKHHLTRHFQANWPSIVAKLQSGENIDLRSDLELMCEIERSLVSLLKDQQISQHDHSLQFPINLRIVNNQAPTNYLDRPYATDYLHCDIWSGAPKDSTNHLLYLFTTNHCSSVVFYHELTDNYAVNYRGPYKAFDQARYQLTERSSDIHEGLLHQFSAYTPHKTVRRVNQNQSNKSMSSNKGVRISLDFKTKSSSPYTYNGEMINEDQFCGYTPGSPGLGIYWSKSINGFNCFNEKAEHELKQAKQHSDAAYQMRLKYIEKATSIGIFSSNHSSKHHLPNSHLSTNINDTDNRHTGKKEEQTQ